MEMQYIFGPVPSRRLGRSLGVSPIPKKTCNYSCLYCQLGRTDRMTNKRKMFFPVSEIMREFETALHEHIEFDVVTIVGEGEPTLYAGLGELIRLIKAQTDKPVVVITNGALLYDQQIQAELSHADIVLPTLDGYDEASFKKINRPHGALKFDEVIRGLVEFSRTYRGQLWLEIMLMKGINDDVTSLERYAELLKRIRYDRLYLNTPVRPPAEPGIEVVDPSTMQDAAERLGGVSIDLLQSTGFHSEIKDDYEAILSIIRRHPMNQFEIRGFLETRGNMKGDAILRQLDEDARVDVIDYKGYATYRLK